MLGRFFIGLSIGCYCYVLPIYIGEISSNEIRGSLLSMFQVFLNIGTLRADEPELSHRLAGLSIHVCHLFPVARVSSRTRPADRSGHPRGKPRQLHRSASHRLSAASRHQLSGARIVVSLSGDRRSPSIVELRAFGPQRRRGQGLEDRSGSVAEGRRHHSLSRGHPNAGRQDSAGEIGHRPHGDQVNCTRRARACLRHL